jgi:penicillin V acylase-like amidase (Ntn superfamily)
MQRGKSIIELLFPTVLDSCGRVSKVKEVHKNNSSIIMLFIQAVAAHDALNEAGISHNLLYYIITYLILNQM